MSLTHALESSSFLDLFPRFPHPPSSLSSSLGKKITIYYHLQESTEDFRQAIHLQYLHLSSDYNFGLKRVPSQSPVKILGSQEAQNT